MLKLLLLWSKALSSFPLRYNICHFEDHAIIQYSGCSSNLLPHSPARGLTQPVEVAGVGLALAGWGQTLQGLVPDSEVQMLGAKELYPAR